MTDMMNMLMTNYYWVEVILAVGMAIYYDMLMTNYYWVEVILAVGMAIYYGPKVFDKK